MKGNGVRATSHAALALAFASFGDAFLYPFLPVNAAAAGVPFIWVGILLSINRFVRIISNSLVVHYFAKVGFRPVMIAAVCLAIFSTTGYGIASGLFAWLIFRIIWGLSFSAMRLGTLGYALGVERQGFALGISRSLQEAGPMLALFAAPFMLTYFDSRSIFFLLAVLSVPGLYFAWRLPHSEDRIQPSPNKRILRWPSTLNAITFVSSILIDGVIVVVLGVLFLRYGEEDSLIVATAMAAFYLGYRRICLFVLSVGGGWIADRIGVDRVFNTSLMLVIGGLLVIVMGWVGAGAIIVFTFYSINVAITTGSVSKNTAHSLAAVAENATWRDIGAAIGTLLGGLLLLSSHINAVLTILTLVLTFLFFIHFGKARKAIKLLYLWR